MPTKKVIAGFATAAALAAGGAATDSAINPYVNLPDRLAIAAESTVKDAGMNSVHLIKDRPEVVLQRWNGEVSLSVRYDKVKAQGSRQLFTDRMEWKGDKEEVHAYPLPATGAKDPAPVAFFKGLLPTAFADSHDTGYGEDGGFEMEVVLSEIPESNVFEFQLEGYENLDFFYQGELTPEEIAEGTERPENIIGSYAVYHKEKRDHRLGVTNYATGKVYHIYRPKIIAADNSWTWGELNYSEGVLSVTVPQEWLASAVYPVRVDPTFGYTTIGASIGTLANVTSDTSNMRGSTASSTAGTVTALYAAVYQLSGTNNVDLFAALYEKDSAAVSSHTKRVSVQRNDVLMTSASRWERFATNGETITSTDMILALAANGEDLTAGTVQLPLDTVTSNVQYFESSTGAGSFNTRITEDPWTQSSSPGPTNYSIYAVYCTIGQPCSETFSTAGTYTWTAPTGVSSADMACWGGGGGADVISASAGGGGGGGAFASTTQAVAAGESWTVIVGAGGDGQTTPTSGGDSSIALSFSTSTLAKGGTFANGTAGGAGGTTTTSIGTTKRQGGNGGTGNTTGDVGGGGGGAAGPHGAGGNGANGTSGSVGGGGGGANNGTSGNASGATAGTGANSGGSGGAGGNGAAGGAGVAGANGGGGGGGGDDTFSGGIGAAPGGGGGGAEVVSGTSGDGAAGQCTITYTIIAAPTVLADSPADASSDSDTTPTFGFTGSSTDGYDLRYNIQIDRSTSFNSATATPTLIATSSVAGLNGGTTAATSTTGATLLVLGVSLDTAGTPTISDNRGNTWTQLTSHTSAFARVRFYYAVNPTTSASHTVTVTSTGAAVSAHFAAFSNVATSSPFDQQNGANGTPVGTLQTGSITPTVDGSLLVTALAFNSAGSPISIDLSFTETGEIDFLGSNYYGSALAFLVQGSAAAINPTWTRTGTNDMAANIASFKPATVPLLDKISGTDSGFSGTPDATDPFTSNQQVTFTVQGGDALAPGTYYWRVRVVDPTGGNTYSAWTATRSFTITGGGGGGDPALPDGGIIWFD